MCNRYFSPPREQIGFFGPLVPPTNYAAADVFPRGQGAFIRSAAGRTEFVVGQWALIPGFANEAKLSYSTNNARVEGVATAASYKQAWAKGRRCLIPAAVFWEPCWESGKSVWWSFRRGDGAPWGLAGLWNTWIDKATGEVVLAQGFGWTEKICRLRRRPRQSISLVVKHKRRASSRETGRLYHCASRPAILSC
jgi:putative SOS response-associated peptidase YedK